MCLPAVHYSNTSSALCVTMPRRSCAFRPGFALQLILVSINTHICHYIVIHLHVHRVQWVAEEDGEGSQKINKQRGGTENVYLSEGVDVLWGGNKYHFKLWEVSQPCISNPDMLTSSFSAQTSIFAMAGIRFWGDSWCHRSCGHVIPLPVTLGWWPTQLNIWNLLLFGCIASFFNTSESAVTS